MKLYIAILVVLCVIQCTLCKHSQGHNKRNDNKRAPNMIPRTPNMDQSPTNMPGGQNKRSPPNMNGTPNMYGPQNVYGPQNMYGTPNMYGPPNMQGPQNMPNPPNMHRRRQMPNYYGQYNYYNPLNYYGEDNSFAKPVIIPDIKPINIGFNPFSDVSTEPSDGSISGCVKSIIPTPMPTNMPPIMPPNMPPIMPYNKMPIVNSEPETQPSDKETSDSYPYYFHTVSESNTKIGNIVIKSGDSSSHTRLSEGNTDIGNIQIERPLEPAVVNPGPVINVSQNNEITNNNKISVISNDSNNSNTGVKETNNVNQTSYKSNST